MCSNERLERLVTKEDLEQAENDYFDALKFFHMFKSIAKKQSDKYILNKQDEKLRDESLVLMAIVNVGILIESLEVLVNHTRLEINETRKMLEEHMKEEHV